MGFQKNPAPCLWNALVVDGEKVLTAAVVSAFREFANLVVTELPGQEVADDLVDSMGKITTKITGIVGPEQTATWLVKSLKERGVKLVFEMKQGIYNCQKVVAPQLSKSFELVMATSQELDLVSQWITDFSKEAIPHEASQNMRPTAEEKVQNKMVYLLKESGRFVAMVGWSRDFLTTVTLNLVYTSPELRGRGFGSTVTALLMEKFLNSGKAETNLYTDLSNPTSNKIFQAIGYQFVSHSTQYRVSR